jgi:hypothetical protein
MLTAYVFIMTITILANAGIAIADLARADFVLANSAEVGVPQSYLPILAALKAAGAAGLLLGLLGAWAIGMAAAIGLIVFFVGAIVAHLRAGVFHNIGFPGAYLALAVASISFMILH